MGTIRKVLDLFTGRERRQAYLLAPLMVVMAAAQVGGIASVAPFLSLLANPHMVTTNQHMAWAFRTFGFHDERSFVVAVGIAVIIALVTSNALLAGGYWVLNRFASMRNHTISRRLLIRYLQQPYEFFLTRNSAALANNILLEVLQIINGVVVPGLQAIANAVAVVGIVIMLVVVNPFLALVLAVVLGGAYVGLYLSIRHYLDRIGRDRVVANQQRYQAANEAMGAIKDLKLTGREAEMVRRFSGPSQRFARHQADSRIIGSLPRFALEAFAFGSVVAIVLILLSLGTNIASIVPVLGLYVFAGYRILPNLQQVFSGVAQVKYSTGALDEVHANISGIDARSAESDDLPDPSDVEVMPFQDHIRLVNVSYHYPSSPDILRGIDLEIPARSSLAFAGTTGAGKSTLIDILLGLLEPTGGHIEVDGEVLTGENLHLWQRQVGYVPQTIFLTDDTITRNIALGLPDEKIDMVAVRRAARMAQIDDFITQDLKEGYDTVIGERGVRLSGGQRQRIGIARALYHDPAVLALDEATSALDAETEHRVFDAIRELAGNKTLIMIAHRLSTIRDCDRIYLLDRGGIESSGTFDELVANSARFRNMATRSEVMRA